MDEADGFLAGRVGFEDLGEPGPEDGYVAEAALALGGIDGGEEFTREHVFKQNGVTTEGTTGDDGRRAADCCLQAALCGGKYHQRKVGQERLFGHAF